MFPLNGFSIEEACGKIEAAKTFPLSFVHMSTGSPAPKGSGLISSWSFPSYFRATVHLPTLPIDPSTFLNSCPALHKHPHPRTPLLPSFLAPCLPLALSPPLNSIFFLACYICYHWSPLLLLSCLPLLFLVSSCLHCNVCPWSSLSIVSVIPRCMFLSLVHIYICVANQQLLSVVCFLHSLVCSIRKTPLNDAC